MADDTNDVGEGTANEGEKQQEQTFTQAEVDRIVKSRATRIAKELYPDYDDLKAAAAGAKTLEERLADVEGKLTAAQTNALRTSIAADYGISTKKGEKDSPSDADLFLTGTDEATLTAQAQRLAGRQAESKKQGNVAPREGAEMNSGDGSSETRQFVGSLFGGSD